MMTQKCKLKYLAMCLCLGTFCSYALGQDARSAPSMERMGPMINAESRVNEPQTLEEKRALKAAQKPQEVQKEKTLPAPEQASTEKTASAQSAMTREESILQLTAEMNANLNNPSYDMDAAVQKLRNSPYVMYPLGHYDPAYPIVFRTGDPALDQQNYDQAKAAWKAAQK